VGEMISPTPPRDLALVLVTSDAAKSGWGTGRIILPVFLLYRPQPLGHERCLQRLDIAAD
jgi:hypothetical protein